MVTKNLKIMPEAAVLQVANIEKDITAKLQFEYLAGFNKSNILVEKTRTKQNNKLNFYIPEKWNYEMEI